MTTAVAVAVEPFLVDGPIVVVDGSFRLDLDGVLPAIGRFPDGIRHRTASAG